jgi:hypothetical protein
MRRRKEERERERERERVCVCVPACRTVVPVPVYQRGACYRDMLSVVNNKEKIQVYKMMMMMMVNMMMMVMMMMMMMMMEMGGEEKGWLIVGGERGGGRGGWGVEAKKLKKRKRESNDNDNLEWEQHPELAEEMEKEWEDWEDPKKAMEKRHRRKGRSPESPEEILKMLNEGGGVVPSSGPKMVFVQMAPHIQGSKRRVDEAGHKWVNLLQTGGVSTSGVAIDEKQYLVNINDGVQLPAFASFMRDQPDCWEFTIDSRVIPCGKNPKNV